MAITITAPTTETGRKDLENPSTSVTASIKPSEANSLSVPLARFRNFAADLIISTAIVFTGGGSVTASIPIVPRRRCHISSETGTTKHEFDLDLFMQLREMFADATNEYFEDGIQSRFSSDLKAFVLKHPRDAYTTISEYLNAGDGSADVVSEALRCLGSISDPATLRDRWFICQDGLRDKSPVVRDGAILAFSDLDDPRARELLGRAQETEQLGVLRDLIGQVLQQLNATAHANVPAQDQANEVA